MTRSSAIALVLCIFAVGSGYGQPVATDPPSVDPRSSVRLSQSQFVLRPIEIDIEVANATEEALSLDRIEFTCPVELKCAERLLEDAQVTKVPGGFGNRFERKIEQDLPPGATHRVAMAALRAVPIGEALTTYDWMMFETRSYDFSFRAFAKDPMTGDVLPARVLTSAIQLRAPMPSIWLGLVLGMTLVAAAFQIRRFLGSLREMRLEDLTPRGALKSIALSVGLVVLTEVYFGVLAILTVVLLVVVGVLKSFFTIELTSLAGATIAGGMIALKTTDPKDVLNFIAQQKETRRRARQGQDGAPISR